jgi:hypothetical protein
MKKETNTKVVHDKKTFVKVEPKENEVKAMMCSKDASCNTPT